MREVLRDIGRSHLGITLGALLAVWAISTTFVPPAIMIELENGILVALGIGIIVAYSGDTLAALRHPHPTRGDILALGIFLSWTSVAIGRSMSAFGRAMHYDLAWFNNHATTLQIFIGALGGVCHLTAPEAVDGWVPRKAWVRIGLVVASGLAIVLTAILLREVILNPALFSGARAEPAFQGMP